MTDALPLVGAAFVTGLLGSAHCFGMCAGISGLFAVNASAASLRRDIPMAIVYNVGRVASYALLGAIVAIVGQAIVDAIPRLAAPVRLFSGLLIIVIGLQVAFNWRVLAPVEQAGARLWNRIAPAARGLLPVTSMPKAFGLGLLWGWLPCGLVYSVLLIAASTAEVRSGALVMIAFGLGTMPAMVATGVSASKLAAFMSRRRFGAGVLIILLGLATIAMPVASLSGSKGHMQHGEHGPSMPQPCSEQWYQHVEARLATQDSQGHGPDPGSSEWRSTVEFKLGIRGDPAIPDRNTDQWCSYIDKLISE